MGFVMNLSSALRCRHKLWLWERNPEVASWFLSLISRLQVAKRQLSSIRRFNRDIYKERRSTSYGVVNLLSLFKSLLRVWSCWYLHAYCLWSGFFYIEGLHYQVYVDLCLGHYLDLCFNFAMPCRLLKLFLLYYFLEYSLHLLSTYTWHRYTESVCRRIFVVVGFAELDAFQSNCALGGS